MIALATPAPRKLPVWSTVGACYAAVLRNLGQLVRISWLWLLVLLPLYAASLWLVWTLWRAEPGEQVVDAVAALPLLVELPFLASIAVAWHRLLLLEERVTGAVYLRLDGIVWRYALLSLALLLIQLVLVPLLSYINGFLVVLRRRDDLGLALILGVGGAAFLALMRLSLVLPAMALGDRASLSGAWRMTRNNTMRLALATGLCAVPPTAVQVLDRIFFADSDTLISYTIGGLVSLATSAVLLIFGVTLLSFAYRFFTGPGSESAVSHAG